MQQRGRKSSARLALISYRTELGRPEPPEDLTPEQAVIWRAIVRDEPVKAFATEAQRESLKGYCWHWALAQHLTQQINAMQQSEATDSNEFCRVVRMRDLEVKAAMSLAVKMRLTTASRTRAAHTSGEEPELAAKGTPWASAG